VSIGIDNATPKYYSTFTLMVNVSNAGPEDASDVTVSVPLPTDLSFISADSADYDANTGAWTIGALNASASATLNIKARGTNVDAAPRVIQAAVSASTPDPISANNVAAVTQTTQQGVARPVIVPDPNNPQLIDISSPGNITWYASVITDTPEAPPLVDPNVIYLWFCDTASSNPCPEADGTSIPNQLSLTYVINTLNVDTYTITLFASFAGNSGYNFGAGSQDSISFTTTAGEGLNQTTERVATMRHSPSRRAI
jgi:uncharacterized repeat protein (TIGR01451 family)